MDLSSHDLDLFFLEASDRYQPGSKDHTVTYEE